MNMTLKIKTCIGKLGWRGGWHAMGAPFLVRFFLLSACIALSPSVFADPYTFDPSDFKTDGPLMAVFTRSDGVLVKLREVDNDGVIASTGSDCLVEVEGQEYFAPHDANDGGTRCIAVSQGGAAEVYFFSNQVLGIPFATQVMRFDGYRFERIGGIGKTLISPVVHIRYHFWSYLSSVVVLASISLILWVLYKVTPKRKWWWLLHGIWFTAGGVAMLLYLSFTMMSEFHSLFIPVAILAAGGVSLRMIWKYVRRQRGSALAT